jgi:hypothetical protein
VKKYGGQVRTAPLDVADEDAAKAAVQVAVDAFGRLDVVVNNAGYGDIAPFEQLSSERFKALIDTNFYGVVNVTRAALPIMRSKKAAASSRYRQWEVAWPVLAALAIMLRNGHLEDSPSGAIKVPVKAVETRDFSDAGFLEGTSCVVRSALIHAICRFGRRDRCHHLSRNETTRTKPNTIPHTANSRRALIWACVRSSVGVPP